MKKIIRCGTKRNGLYYMDDFNLSRVKAISRSKIKKKYLAMELLIWTSII